MRSDFTLSVMVPVFNERLTIRQLIDRVRAVPIRKEIIIVDDASTDGTTDVVREIAAQGNGDPNNRIRALYHAENAGKGAAIRTAIEAVTGDIALIQDADLEYDPNEYPVLIEPILAGHADVVFGSRFLSGPHRVLFFRHSMGNKLLTFLSNLFTDLNLTDMETCYKVFRSDVLKRLHLVSNRFGIEPEITAKVARLGARVYEVPISYHGREYWEGKKIGWKDGVAAIWTIARCALVDDAGNAGGGRRPYATRRYNDWIWSRIAPWVGDRVLEVGAGMGAITRYLRNHPVVVVTENDPEHLALLRSRFGHHDAIRVEAIDWSRADGNVLASEHFDTVLCLDALAHIERDDDALAVFARLLNRGGRLIVHVPALHWLYGEADRALGHFRRYDRDELIGQLRRHGFTVETTRYVNVPGLVVWYLNARLLRRRGAPALQARITSALVPWLRIEERINPRWGMTLLVVARKEA
jgi:glycosyltransferase involved in cell wall biosynthesis